MAIAAPGQLNLAVSPAWGSRTVDYFEKLEQIGEGTYGKVYRAKDIKTGEIVAVKKILMDNEREGFPITAIREIKILKKLQHENVVKLKEIVASNEGGVYMVFEYMDHDLAGLAVGRRFSVPQIKCYMKQLLTGLHYCHVNHVLHRDIKAANLLIDIDGNLKIADFGLARSHSSSDDNNGNMTNRVITLWYRPPELLLGATKYGPAIDMRSVGCIFAELLQAEPIFQGNVEAETLNKIFQVCGSPDENNWPGVSKLPLYSNFKPPRPLRRRVRELFKNIDGHALDLLDKMLTLDPSQRISAKDALDADYFWTDPLPCDPKSLPKYESSHELQAKKKRQQQQRLHDENAKRQKLQHQEQHNRLPPIQQTGQGHSQMHSGPSQSLRGSQQPPVPAGYGHYYNMKPPRGPSGGVNKYSRGGGNHPSSGGYNHPSRGQAGGGYGSGAYPPHGRVPPNYGGSSNFPGGSCPRGAAASGYGSVNVGPPPNYSQAGPYGGSGLSRNTHLPLK